MGEDGEPGRRDGPASGVGEFLRARRARISPEAAGLRSGADRRRVRGLRREEVARLAGVSVDYYVRLEQGRARNVSAAVLDAVATALGLSAVERAHLADLARAGRAPAAEPVPESVDPVLQRLLDAVPTLPLVIAGRRVEIRAWNDAAQAVFDLAGQRASGRTAPHYVFLDPAARAFYANWETVARGIVTHLRLESGRYPEDEVLLALVEELTARSADFRRLWAAYDLAWQPEAVHELHHPTVGRLRFDYRVLAVTGTADLVLVAYTYPPGSPTAARMSALLSAGSVVEAPG